MGVVFMIIMNYGDEVDCLIFVMFDVVVCVELYIYMEIGDGVMKMMYVEEGFDVFVEGVCMFDCGGDYVMFMGLI